MLNFVKKTTSIILILTVLFSVFAMNTSAAEVEEDYGVMPCWSTINNITTCFTISGLNSTSTVTLYANSSTSLYIKIELQKLKSGTFETLETWTKSGTGTYLSLEEKRLINIFSDYRIKVTCTAGSETHVTYDYP